MSDKFEPEQDDQSLWRRVVDAVKRRNLVAGDLVPSEAALCRELGAGRQQVREALSALEALGAVTTRQGARRVWKGFGVEALLNRSISLLDNATDGVHDLLEVRHALETALLPTAAHKLRRTDLDDLRVLAQGMVARAEAGQSFSDLDERFHLGLFGALKNPVLDAILKAFWGAFVVADPEARGDSVDSPTIAGMHERIIDAIESGDIRRAVYELDSHFYGVQVRFPERGAPQAALPVV